MITLSFLNFSHFMIHKIESLSLNSSNKNKEWALEGSRNDVLILVVVRKRILKVYQKWKHVAVGVRFKRHLPLLKKKGKLLGRIVWRNLNKLK